MSFDISKSVFNPNELKASIVRRGLSVANVNKILYPSSDGLYKMLRGKMNPTVDFAYKVSKVLDLNANEFNTIFFSNKLPK